MVVWYHMAGFFLIDPAKFLITNQTWTGVDLFFVISGFVVSGSFFNLFSLNESSKYGQVWWLFLKKRFTRILPVAWLWAFIPLLMTFIPSQEANFSTPGQVGQEFLAIVLFVYNYFFCFTGKMHLIYYWTLATEEHFYFLLPLLFYFSRNKKFLSRVCVVLLVSVATSRFLYPSHVTIRQFHYLSNFRFDGLIIGVLLFLNREWIFSLGAKLPPFVGRIMAVLSFATPVIVPGNDNFTFLAHYGLFCVALASGVLVWLATLNRSFIFGGGSISKGFYFFGKRSYSLYLINIPCTWLVREAQSLWQWSGILQVIVFLLLSLGITELNYRFIELPLVKKSQGYKISTAKIL
jgi:peptidoglycan/LPS O-acetylase OafA/YrhL